MTDNWPEHWHSYPMFQPSHTRNFGFEIRIGWCINTHLRYQWHVPWCVNWVVRNFICWLGFVYHWFRLFTFLIRTKQIISKLKVHLKWPDYPSRLFFFLKYVRRLCNPHLNINNTSRKYCCNELVPWGATPSLDHLGPTYMGKHYETCGETLSFDTFFLWALRASRQPGDSKEHIFIKQWPLEDAKKKQIMPQWNINQSYQQLPYASTK